PEIAHRFSETAIEIDGVPIAGLRLLKLTLRLQEDPEIVVGGRELRIEAERLACEVDRRIAVAARVAHATEQEPSHGPLRRAGKEITQTAFGFIKRVSVELPPRQSLDSFGRYRAGRWAGVCVDRASVLRRAPSPPHGAERRLHFSRKPAGIPER